MTVDECQAKVSSSNFVRHLMYLEWRVSNPTVDQHYMMQIAMEVARVLAEKPHRIKLEHFKLQSPEPEKELTQEEYLARSKAFWTAVINTPQKPPPPKHGKQSRT
jgi:hypothetical protein